MIYSEYNPMDFLIFLLGMIILILLIASFFILINDDYDPTVKLAIVGAFVGCIIFILLIIYLTLELQEGLEEFNSLTDISLKYIEF